MLIPGDIDPEPFFLTVHSETGEIYCAHQEVLALDDGQGQLLLSRARADDVVEIALKANPAARAVRDQLRVVRVVCEPTTNFSRYRVDVHRNELTERAPRATTDTDARIGFDDQGTAH